MGSMFTLMMVNAHADYMLSREMEQAAREGDVKTILVDISNADQKDDHKALKAFKSYIKNNPDFVERAVKFIQAHPEITEGPINEAGDTMLISALEDLEGKEFAPLILALIEHTQNLDARDEGQNFALLEASSNSEPEGTQYVQKLLKRRASVILAGDYGVTPLMAAASAGNVDTVALLLSKNAYVDAVDDFEKTALFHAIQWYEPEVQEEIVCPNCGTVHRTPTVAQQKTIITLLLRRGANLEARERINHWTPFLYAMNVWNLPIVQFLAQKGADVNARDIFGFDGIFFVLKRGDIGGLGLSKEYSDQSLAMLKELISLPDIDIEARFVPVDIFWPQLSQFTPLMAAAYFLDYPAVKLLVENGADIQASTKDGQTAYSILQHIIKVDQKNIVRKRQAELILAFLKNPRVVIEREKAMQQALFEGKNPRMIAALSKMLEKYFEGSSEPKDILLSEVKTMLNSKKPEKLKGLIDQHPEVLALADTVGDTPLLLAIESFNADAVGDIIKKLEELDEQPEPEKLYPEQPNIARDHLKKALEHTNLQELNALALIDQLLSTASLKSHVHMKIEGEMQRRQRRNLAGMRELILDAQNKVAQQNRENLE